MTLFKKAESTSAYLKAGFLGFAGSGKTKTATKLAIGLALMAAQLKLKEAGRPIYFLDTETGSDYVIDDVRAAGLEIYAAKTRAFADLIPAVYECENEGSVLIIDSVTHFWREFTDSYKKRKKISRLEFQDWDPLKSEWAKFTDAYVNSACHIIMCGRAGYEYDNEVNERTQKREIFKSGIKMKAETETGFEPSLLVLMERAIDLQTNVVTRTGYVLKDRFSVIDGKSFDNPTFEDFKPHIERLTLGGTQLGVDTTRNSEHLIREDGMTQWKHERTQKEICLDEIQEELVKSYPGQSHADKKAKADLLEAVFGTRSWTAVENMPLDDLRLGRDAIWLKSRGHKYGETPKESAA